MTDCPNGPAVGWWIFKKRYHTILHTYELLSFSASTCVYCGCGVVKQSLSSHLPPTKEVPRAENIAAHEEFGYKFEWDEQGRMTHVQAPNGQVATIKYDELGRAQICEDKKEVPT
jgi:YD repeat-containing protein